MEPHRIVIRGPNWLGDSVLSVPAMKAVRSRFPNAEITLLVRPWVAGLFHAAPFVDKVWSHSKPGLSDWIRTARQMRRRKFDLALLLPNSFESALTVFAGGVPERTGYATDARGILLTQSVAVPTGKRHQAAYYLDLVESLFGPVSEPTVEITATEDERQAARQLLRSEAVDPAKGILVINPGAAFGSAKRWHEGRFARVADQLAEELKLQTVVIGSDAERPIGECIQRMMQHRSAVLSGQTDLETLIGLLAEASLVITNDSGPMHIAAALGVPTVAIFGSTDAEVTRPVGLRTRVVRQEVACSPCMLRECPIDHRCMEAVTVDQVFEAAKSMDTPLKHVEPHA